MKTYTLKDYKSGDGMLTTVWGPGLWHFLHTMSFNYPDEPTKENKLHYMKFIYQLKHILPCKYCRINLKKNFKSLPLKMEHMKSRYTFSKYIYDLHEHINKMLNKKSGLTYDDVRERYEHFRARCNIIDELSKKKYKTHKKKEKGCTEPLYGKKSKCVIKIVPQTKKCNTFQMDESCKKKRLTKIY
jgi:hypothetical protein